MVNAREIIMLHVHVLYTLIAVCNYTKGTRNYYCAVHTNTKSLQILLYVHINR